MTQWQVDRFKVYTDLQENPRLRIEVAESIMLAPSNEYEKSVQQLAILLTTMYGGIEADTIKGVFMLKNIRANNEGTKKFLSPEGQVYQLIQATWSSLLQEPDGRIIGKKDDNIYYTPYQAWYDDLLVNLTAWDQVFDTVEEAEEAWYTKSDAEETPIEIIPFTPTDEYDDSNPETQEVLEESEEVDDEPLPDDE